MKTIITLLILLSISAYAQMQQVTGPCFWTNLGALNACRGNSNIVFGTSYDGVYKSEDKASTWTKVSNQGNTEALEVCPSNSNYIITDKERSTDGGQSWIPSTIETDLFRFKPGSTSVVYRTNYGLYKTTDFGSTWNQITIPGGGTIYDLEVDYNNPSYIYALCYDSLKKSTNDGANWSTVKVVTSGSCTFYSLAVSPANSSIIYVGGEIGSTYYIFKTTNGGANFTQTAISSFPDNLTVDIQNTNILYCGLQPLRKSTDGGATWFITAAQNYFLRDFQVTTAGQIYGYGDQIGALLSEDKCASFKSIGPLATTDDVHVLAVDNNLMYGWGSGLYKTTNGGLFWFPLTDAGYGDYDGLAVSQSNSNKLYMTNGNSINVSTDGGTTWTNHPISTGTYFEHVWVNRLNEQIIFVQSWDDGSVSKTTNGGTSWSIVNLPVTPNSDYYPIRLSQTDANTLYYLARNSSNSGQLFKSTNLGSTWTELTVPLEAYDRIWDLRTTNDNKLILSALSLYVSNDQGITWANKHSYAGTGLAINYLYVNPANSSKYYSYYYQSGGLNLLCGTTDGGATWFDAHTGIPRTTQHIYEGSLSSGGKLFIETDKYLFAGVPIFAIGINTISTNIPVRSVLYDNYPNPFNPATKIRFDVSNRSSVSIIIYDIMGRELTKLVNEVLGAGTYEVDWNSSSIASGTYFYRMVTNGYTETKKMILIK